jgi:YrbI family 3-deoxy-D-manno-octulosonate 8-phosphate phosphatase
MNAHEHLRPDLLALVPERTALLVLDFDGVMTDDRVYVDQDGREMVACSRGDGLGLTLLRREGVPVLVLSTEQNPVVAARCRKVKVECIQGCDDKVTELRRLLEARGIPAERTVYVGNDLNDLGPMRLAGCSLAPSDAHPLAKKAARGVLSRPGGHGAVRETAEMILARMGIELAYGPAR